MKSKIQELKFINTIDVSKTIKNIKKTTGFVALLLAVMLFASCSKDDSNGNEEPEFVLIPDLNFEQALIDLGFDTNGLDGTILKSDAAAVTELHINSKNISDLTGLEAFVNVIILNCDNNEFTSINIDNLIHIEELYCDNNNLDNLDASNKASLQILKCDGNRITNLDVSNSINLEVLYARYNELESLNLNDNSILKSLVVNVNELAELDLSNNTMLISLSGTQNKLEYLNLDANINLQVVRLHDNLLRDLSLLNGNNTNITSFSAYGNINLNCIQVDNPNYSAFYWAIHVDPNVSFLVNCN